jgi:ABC-type transporter Mla subunit MlaD
VPTIALAVAVCLIGWKKRRRCMQIILLAAVFISLGLISACGGGSGTGGGGGGGGGGPKSYTVTVTATSGSIQQNTAISLTVN